MLPDGLELSVSPFEHFWKTICSRQDFESAAGPSLLPMTPVDK
jgi:hypothetical protein